MRYPVIGQRYKKSGMQKFETNGRSPSNYGCLLNAAPHNPGIELGQRENQIRTNGLELAQYRNRNHWNRDAAHWRGSLGTRGKFWRWFANRGLRGIQMERQRRSLPHAESMRCDHCRKSFGLILHRYFRMRFCSADCLSAYQRRLDGLTMIKIRSLELPRTLPS